MAIRSLRPPTREVDWKRYLWPAALVVVLLLLIMAVNGYRSRHKKTVTVDNNSTVTSSDFTVFISPGDGGTENGPIYPENSTNPEVKSKDVVLAIAQAAQRALAKEGVNVVLSRSDDTLVDSLERKDKANQANAKLAIAIYLNEDYTNTALAGFQIVDYKQADWVDNYKQRMVVAKQLEKSMSDRLLPYGVQSTGIYMRNSAFTPDMPTLVLLPGFISNDTERSRLVTEDYQWLIANAITDAVLIYRDQYAAKGNEMADIAAEPVIQRLHVPF